MSSLSDKPVAATKTESAFEKTAPPKDTNDVEPKSATESLFGPSAEEEPAPQTEIPAKTSTAEADPVTDFVYEPSPEEPIPVTDSVFVSQVEPEVPQKSTGSTVEIAPEDFNPQTEILFETASPDPVKEREEQTDLTSHALPITEIPFEYQSMDELSQDFTLENETDSVHEHPRTSDAVLETELPTTPLLDTELSFDSHENIIPRQKFHINPQVEYVTNLSPLESIVTDNTHDGVTVETETQLGNANETKDTPEELGHSLDIAGREHILPQNTIVKSVDSEDVLLAESQQNVIHKYLWPQKKSTLLC
nr:proteoglycan 4-like [Penaeus vannamei]